MLFGALIVSLGYLCLNHFAVAGDNLADPVPHPLISLFFCGYNEEHIQLISVRVSEPRRRETKNILKS